MEPRFVGSNLAMEPFILFFNFKVFRLAITSLGMNGRSRNLYKTFIYAHRKLPYQYKLCGVMWSPYHFI